MRYRRDRRSGEAREFPKQQIATGWMLLLLLLVGPIDSSGLLLLLMLGGTGKGQHLETAAHKTGIHMFSINYPNLAIYASPRRMNTLLMARKWQFISGGAHRTPSGQTRRRMGRY